MPLLLLVVVLAGLGAVGLARMSVVVSHRSGAQQAADAAALAGARVDQSEAARLAAANGASLSSYSQRQIGTATEVHVVVDQGGITASATALWDPPPPPPTMATTTTTTSPDNADKIDNAGTTVPTTAG
jgi:hypothetical protein